MRRVRRPGETARRDFRNGRVHVARTGARRARGSPERYLLARLRALRDAGARASVPRRRGSRSVRRYPQRSAARSGAHGRGIPVRVEALVRRCLEKNPDHRFQSAGDLAFALRDVLSDSGHLTRASGIRALKPRLRVGPLIMLGVLMAVTTVFWLAGGPRSVFRRSTPIRALAVLPLDSPREIGSRTISQRR